MEQDIPDAFSDRDYNIVLPYEQLMSQPLQLVRPNETGGFQLVESTVQLLHQLETPVVVVGIVGTYRSGKSYLMNLLIGKKSGFELGSTVESKTKGIWIWCHPHPTIPDTTLILLDSEGLEDVTKGDDNYDMRIIALTLLLSSSFIFNTIGRVDSTLIKHLGFVTELTRYIQVRTGQIESDDTDFDLYFPTLIVAVRDFYLQLSIQNRQVSAQEYFEYCLKLKEVTGKNSRQLDEYNEPRLKIRKYFPNSKRFCFVLPQPTKSFTETALSMLPFLSNNDMNPEFMRKARGFQLMILNISKRKNFGQCDKVNGRMFADMVQCYIDAFEGGGIPCIQSALRMTAMLENRRILDECLKNYETHVGSLALPMNEEELLLAHKHFVSIVTDEFKGKIIFEEAEEIRAEFEMRLSGCYSNLLSCNEAMSHSKCEEILARLNRTLEKKYKAKIYLVPGGYELYMRDLNELKQFYMSEQHKGVKSEQVLHDFIQKKEAEINNIVAMDKEMTTMKVKEEAEKRLRVEIESREKLLREEVERSREREETLRKTLKETHDTMQRELEVRLDEQKADFERAMSERELTHQQLCQEMKHEIEQLKSRLPLSRRFCVIS